MVGIVKKRCVFDKSFKNVVFLILCIRNRLKTLCFLYFVLEIVKTHCVLMILIASTEKGNTNNNHIYYYICAVSQRLAEKRKSYILSPCVQGCKLRRSTSTGVVGKNVDV